MVFYVYMQPEVIGDAANGGRYGMQYLIALLRGLLQNCCLLEFCDGRSLDEMKEQVESLPGDFDRVAVKKILGRMAKLNRFVYCLDPDDSGKESDLDCVFEQASRSLLDLLLVAEVERSRDAPEGVEISSLSDYQYTPFEEERSLRSSDGRTTPEGGMGETDFLACNFLRALRHARKIEVCDRLAGTKFAENYEHTIRQLMGWLAKALADPSGCSIVFHFGEADGKKPAYIKGEISGYRAAGALATTPTEIRYYHTDMPHQRFILTDQFAIEIDRGLDFLDRATHRNRDVSVNTKSHSETSKLLAAYAGNLAGTEVL